MRVYKYFDMVLYLLLFIANAFSKIYLLLNFRARKILRYNRNIRVDAERCFIVGNGPSLKKEDLMKLKGEDTFVTNWFYKYNSDFSSKFYLAVDTAFFSGEGFEYIKNVYKKYPEMKFILNYDAYKREPEFWDMKRTFFLFPKLFQYGDYVRFDCEKNMTACINVVLQCIQVALYMGYKKIYLLGCDFNQYAQLRPNHFYDSNLNRTSSMGEDARWSSMAHFHHYALQKVAKKLGVEIINLTESSLIDAYPKDSLSNIL